MEPGDTGIISIPIRNQQGGVDTIKNMRVVVAVKPAWINISTDSFMGPIDIYPGEKMTFTVDWEIATSYDPNSSTGEIVVDLISDSPAFVPSGYQWRFSTENGFKTIHGKCTDNTGVACGEYVSPDVLSPNTEIFFDGMAYTDSQSKFFISTETRLNFEGYDSYESNTEISRVSVVGYKLESQPADFEGLTPISEPVVLPEGTHTLYFASRDYSGNTEVVKSTVVVVDGTAPGPVTGITVDGAGPGGWNNTGAFNLSWINPSDVSGVAGVRVKYGEVAPLSNEEGVFYPADSSLTYSSTETVSGVNVVWLWLEDNVGNADPSMAVSVELRYDGGLPGSTASAPEFAGTRLVQVGFNAWDAVSGVRETALWRRLNGGEWSSGTYTLAGNTGTFSFDTGGLAGTWDFYPQAFDNAGNGEPVPVSTTAPKASASVDLTAPVISNVRVTEITYDTARISWETDDEASGVVEYTLPGAAAAKTYASSYYTSQSLLLSGLVYPANYTFNITAANKAGLSAVYTGGAFYVPPKMTTNVNDLGVLNIDHPIIIEVTNPYVSSITYTLNGQTVTQNVTLNTPLEIYVNSGQGATSLSLNLDGYVYSTSFVVDTATRTVYLSRIAIVDGGLDAAQGGWAAQAAVGQGVAGELANVGGKAYLGYYAGIDPVAPGSITNLGAVSGPAKDQATLAWTASGDDAYAGTAMKYDIRWSTNPIDAASFSAAARAAEVPFPLAAGTAQTALLSGLNQLATYYFSVRVEDELGNLSGLSNAASVFKGYVLAGTVTVNGVSEISFMSPVPPSIALISTVSASGAVAIGSAAAAGLTLAGNLYEIGPEGTFDPPAVLTFYYSASAIAALGLLDSDLAIYEHFPEGWQKLPGQVLDTAAHKITVPVTRIASLFAVFGIIKDRAAPVTGISYAGNNYQTGGKLFAGAGSSVTLSAYDPVVYGTSTGVTFTEYRVDPGTATAFAVYGGPFGLAEGFHEIEYRSRDNAGNQEAARAGEVYVDTSAPATAALVAGTAGRNGWYVSPSTVTLVSTDSLSGLAAVYYRAGLSTETLTYTVPLSVSSEGLAAFYYFAADNVANVETEQAVLIKTDLAAPEVVAVSSPAANGYGWNNSAVGVVYSGTDAVSGIAYCSPEVLVVVEGASQTLSGYCSDQAGWSSTSTYTISIDTTPPAVSYIQTPAANAAGWNNTEVRVGFSASDALSGPAWCEPEKNADTEGAGVAVSGYCLDYAGNASTAALTLNIDRTAPAIAISSPAAGAVFIAARDKIGVYFGIKDNLDPAPEVTALLTQIEDRGSPRGVRPSTVAVAVGQLLEPLEIDDGVWRLDVTAVDVAGNISSAAGGGFEVLHDILPPRTGLGTDTAKTYSSGGLSYVRGDTTFSLSSVDDLTAVNDGIGLGVKRQSLKVKDPQAATTDMLFENMAPAPGAVFVSTFNLSGRADGAYLLAYHAADTLGNAEEMRISSFNVDNTPPASAWRAEGDQAESGGKFYLNALGKVVLGGADQVVAGVASGLEGVYYGIDGGSAGKYAIPIGLAEGVRTVVYNAKDNLGNTEILKSTVVHVDGSKPASALSIAGDQYRGEKIYVSTRSEILITASDPLVNDVAAGVLETSCAVDGGAFAIYSSFALAAEGKRLVRFYSADRVANVEEVNTSELWVDASAPETALSVSGPRYDASGTIYLTKDSGILLAAADPVNSETASGVLFTKYRVDGGNWQVYDGSFTITAEGRHTLEYHSLDRVLNTEGIRTAMLAVDNTPPVTNITLGEPGYEAFGLPLISPDTPVSLAAADITAAETASGLQQIFYEPVNVADGSSAVSSYTEPFKLPQGTYDIRYWSVDNVGNTEVFRQLRLAVTTLRSDALAAVEGLALSGTADIAGAVESNAVVSVSGSSRILGDVTASTITLSGAKAQITGRQVNGVTPLTAEPILLAAVSTAAAGGVPAEYLADGKFLVSSKTELTLSTGIYYFKGMELSGGCNVRVNGKVDILVEGDVLISGGSSLNATGAASGLHLFVKGSSVTFTGGGNLAAVVYAPYSHLKLAGNALLGGHYFVKTAAVSGTGNLVQSGESLPAAAPASGGGKKVSALGAGSSYSVLAGPDPEFKLGEVYVYPNPAKGGQAPTIHLECGIADSVSIKIYTVSGREAHTYAITSAPVALDDGNGLSYAYEYTWNGHIPSGVYYYFLEAERAGKKLKKTGKFAVVR